MGGHRAHRPALPALGRAFEATRLQEQWAAAAYDLVVSAGSRARRPSPIPQEGPGPRDGRGIGSRVAGGGIER